MSGEQGGGRELRAQMNDKIDIAIATAKAVQRIHPDFILVGKARQMLLDKLVSRWPRTEVERREELAAIIISCYLVGYQYGFDSAVDAMHDFEERKRLV